MGTLQNQQPRKWLSVKVEDIIEYSEMIKKIAMKTELSVDQVIKILEIKELERRNNLYVSNGDIHDEQMAGIGDYLEKINSNLGDLSTAMGDLALSVGHLDPKND